MPFELNAAPLASTTLGVPLRPPRVPRHTLTIECFTGDVASDWDDFRKKKPADVLRIVKHESVVLPVNCARASPPSWLSVVRAQLGPSLRVVCHPLPEGAPDRRLRAMHDKWRAEEALNVPEGTDTVGLTILLFPLLPGGCKTTLAKALAADPPSNTDVVIMDGDDPNFRNKKYWALAYDRARRCPRYGPKNTKNTLLICAKNTPPTLPRGAPGTSGLWRQIAEEMPSWARILIVLPDGPPAEPLFTPDEGLACALRATARTAEESELRGDTALTVTAMFASLVNGWTKEHATLHAERHFGKGCVVGIELADCGAFPTDFPAELCELWTRGVESEDVRTSDAWVRAVVSGLLSASARMPGPLTLPIHATADAINARSVLPVDEKEVLPTYVSVWVPPEACGDALAKVGVSAAVPSSPHNTLAHVANHGVRGIEAFAERVGEEVEVFIEGVWSNREGSCVALSVTVPGARSLNKFSHVTIAFPKGSSAVVANELPNDPTAFFVPCEVRTTGVIVCA